MTQPQKTSTSTCKDAGEGQRKQGMAEEGMEANRTFCSCSSACEGHGIWQCEHVIKEGSAEGDAGLEGQRRGRSEAR